jgi:hypothetical protein
MKSKIMSIVLCVVMFAASYVMVLTMKNVSAHFTEEWVARYNGLDNYRDFAYSMAVDASGNVYVTGESQCYDDETGFVKNHNYTTIKYDTYGNELWVAIYNGPGNIFDIAQDIAVDSLGNVLVTGVSSNGIDEDYATIKYDPDGNELWVERYDGGDNDRARAIAVDYQGYVYITGESGYKYLTVKYDSDGNQIWESIYDKGSGEALDIAVDESSGNVYVTGRNDNDMTTIAYDQAGNELWVKRRGPSSTASWRCKYMALDPNGNVYVTGATRSNGSSDDYTTIKYDSMGNEIWVAYYNGPGDGMDTPYGMVVDSSGNVYVTGQSYSSYPGNEYRKYVTIKYDQDGNQIWMAEYNDGWGRGIAIDDSSEIVYVTGPSYDGGIIFIMTTIAYDMDGNELAVAKYNGPGGDDKGICVAVDPAGNVYVSGYSDGNGTYTDYCTIKYSQTFLNQPPVADAGPDQIIMQVDIVQFNGSASYDPDGTIITYEWDFDASDGLWWETGAPPDAFGPNPTFTYGKYGTFIATLRVTDNNGSMDTDICEITVLVPPLPPVLYINVSKNGEDVVLNWDPPPVLGIDHYLIYRSTSQTNFDFTTIWKNTSIDKELGEPCPLPLRTMWNDTNAAFPGNATNYSEQYYYTIRAVNIFGEVSRTSRTVGKWTKTFPQGASTFSLPLEPIEPLNTDYCISSMNADYIKYIDPTNHTWVKHNFGDGNTNNTQMKLGEGYEVKFSSLTNFTFTGMPAAMINYDDTSYGFDATPESGDAQNLTVFIDSGGNVIISWVFPKNTYAGVTYFLYRSNKRDGFWGTAGVDYEKFYSRNASSPGEVINVWDPYIMLPGTERYYMVVPLNGNPGRNGVSSYSIGIWIEEYLDQYDTFGLPLKLETKETADWYCDNIPDSVGINYYFYSEQRWCWHSTRMPKEAYDPPIEMTEGYQISTSNHTKFTFIGV